MTKCLRLLPINLKRTSVNNLRLLRPIYTLISTAIRHFTMPPVEVEDAINVYREYSRIPTLANAYVNNSETPGHIRVTSEWSLRDLERSTKVKFARQHIAQLNDVYPTFPTDVTTESLRRESSSGRYCAILRSTKDKKGEDKQYIEIWDDANKIQNIDVASLEQHGKVYDDSQFSCFEWSHSETHLLYVAEKKRPTAKSYFDKSTKKTAGEEEDSAKGDEFLHRDDWGEQLLGKSSSVLCVLDVEAGQPSVLENLPDDVFPGQAIWCKDDAGVVCVGWYQHPYKLGIIYCPMRRNSIFYIDLKTTTCTSLGSTKHSVRSPRFSPDFSKLVWLQNPAAGPHFQCSQLVMCDWSTKGIVTVLDIVRKAKADQFQGVFTLNLPRRCWSTDSQRIVFSSQWRSGVKAVVVDTTTGSVSTLPSDANSACVVVKDVCRDLVVAKCSSPNQPNSLVVGQLPAAGKEDTLTWTSLDTEPPPFLDFTWRTVAIQPPEDQVNTKYGPMDYEVVLLEPTQVAGQKPPLVVYPHGGPHSMMPADFLLYPCALCKLGYAVMMVNYRGSSGFGQDNINSLPGNIGTQDVKDVQHAVKTILEMEVADEKDVYVIGGSHGGFITAHLIGQYPGFYQAACCRNPVINISTMLGGTDIPDWSYTEGGLAFDFSQTGHAAVYDELWKRSPIRHIDQVRTPTMIMLGAEDHRVPPQQGRELWKALRTRNVPVRMVVYPDNHHAIDKVEAEADAFINIYKWFKSKGDASV